MRGQKHLYALRCLSVSMQVGMQHVRQTSVLRYLCLRIGHSWAEMSIWGKKYKKKREVKRLSAVASEQHTPELSQGVLVARHVDRPWQVAWVHVAQPELLLYFAFAERRRGRHRKRKRGACCSEQHQPSPGESARLAPFRHNSTVPLQCVAKGR